MLKNAIYLAEKEIDLIFAGNRLKSIGYTQAIWTLLNIAEEHYLKITTRRPLKTENELNAYVDKSLNSLNYPLRVCYKESDRSKNKLEKKMIDEDYKSAIQWLDDADDYGLFCSIFPLWHRNKIEIELDGYNLIPSDWTRLELEYEAYNRLFRKDAKEELLHVSNKDIFELIAANTKIKRNIYYINFNPKIVNQLYSYFSKINEDRYNLPGNWEFTYFTIGDFKILYTTIQSMLYGWFVGRKLFYQDIEEFGYCSSVWVVSMEELSNRLKRYTNLNEITILKILEYLTYGGMEIREPDIALQPLVDLNNGYFALSPFVWTNTNAERNLCTLLNQIPQEKAIYAKLVNEKETLLRKEIKDFLKDMNYDVKSGSVENTNIDCAIIDRTEKVCLIMELKWFIEPAEIREVIARSEELEKGVFQAKRLNELFKLKNAHMLNDVLKIDANYSYLSIVASRNWIGEFDVQDDEVPIVKVWPILNKIKEYGSLNKVIHWLRNKEYLPKRDIDFWVKPVNISFGKWKSKWYGLKPS